MTLVSDVVENCCTDFFWSEPLICMDAQRNLHGSTMEFTWTLNRICINAQRNLHGGTMEFALMLNGIFMAWLGTSLLAFGKNKIDI